MEPRHARKEIRDGKRFLVDTSGTCPGFTQVNLTMLPDSVAEDFEGFCRANEGPMPLLFKSEPGQFTAPPLGVDIDVRTDLGAYELIENGETSGMVGDLMKYNDRIRQHVSFYMGCSYSFEKEYLDAGLPLRALQQRRSTPLYLTNVQCAPYGVFNNIQQFSSMRPIPKQQLQLATKVTLPMTKYHGAPMHIGDPGMIGVDITKPDHGETLEFEDDDVPVFWSCGATGIPAIKNCGVKLGITQAVNCLMVTDVPTEKDDLADDITVEVIEVQKDPFFASIVSKSKLEEIKDLLDNSKTANPDQVLKSAMLLSHSSKVAVLVDENVVQLTNGGINEELLLLLQVMEMLKMEVLVLVPETTSNSFMGNIKAKLFTKVQNMKVERTSYMDNDGSALHGEYQTLDYAVLLTQYNVIEFVECVKKASKRVTFTAISINDLDARLDFQIKTKYDQGCRILASLLVIMRSCPIHERYQKRNVGYPQSTKLTESLRKMIINI